MDFLAILLLILAVALVASSWTRANTLRFFPADATLQNIMSGVITVIIVPVGLWVLFWKANATPVQTQAAAGFLGTCFGYWFKR